MEKKFSQEELDQQIQEFKKFAFQGSISRMAIAFILGASFKNVVTEFSNDILMPIIQFFINSIDGNWKTLKIILFNEICIDLGKFMGCFLDFMITAIILYIFYKKILNGKDENV